MTESTRDLTANDSVAGGRPARRPRWLLVALLGAAVAFFVLLGGSPLAHAAERASGGPVAAAPAAAPVFDDVRLAATTGTLSGNVKGSEGGATHPNLQNIEVDLYSGDGASYLTYATTNSVGNYSFTGLAPGTYKLQFNGDGTHFGQWFNNKTSAATGNTVTVTAGGTTTASVLLTKSVGNISGKVTSATAAYPVDSSLEVDLLSGDGASYITYTTTDLNGNYSFTDVPIGSYQIRFYGDGTHFEQYYLGSADAAGADPVVVTSAATTANVNAALVASVGSISGTVSSSSTAYPVDSGTEVDLLSADGGSLVTYTTTDLNGNYSFANVPVGQYQLHFFGDSTHFDQWYNASPDQAGADLATVSSGAASTGINAVLQTSVGTVSGTVSSASGDYPVTSGTEVDLLSADGGSLVAYTYTDGAGNYSFSDIAVGTYTIRFYGDATHFEQYYSNKTTSASATPVVVTTAGGTTANAALVVSVGVVSGTVSSSSAAYPVTSGTEVDLLSADGGSLVAYTYTDGAGNYSFSDIAVGTYTIRFYGDATHFEQYYSNKTTSASATPVVVTSAGTKTANATLVVSVGRITGKIASSAAGNAPLTSHEVDVYTPGGASLYTYAYTDEAGNFAIENVPVGSYTVYFQGDGTYFGEWYNDKPTVGYSNPVVVGSAATAAGINGLLSTVDNDHALTPAPTPTISGTAKVGNTLTATTGTFGPGTPTKKIQWYRGSTSITGATSATYLVVPADAGQTLTVKVTASLTGFKTITKSSTPTAAVALGDLTTTTPTISGTARVDSTLTATAAAWGPAPVNLAYQWLANGTAIAGATGTTYTLTVADLGKTVTVAVTGTKTGYTTATTTSAGVSVAPGILGTATPTISGTVQVGQTLTAAPGTWSPAPVDFTYAWSAAGAAIPGATASTYVIAPAYVNKTITVSVTGTKAGYTTATTLSAPTAAAAPGILTTAVPTISGTFAVGQTLSVDAGAWGPAPVTFSYQWKASGANITGATGSTLVLSPAERGKTIKVSVTGAKPGYASASQTSAVSAAVGYGTLSTVTPTISGTAGVGSTLTASAGTWGPAPVTLAYQWSKAGAAIPGATASTYAPVSADIGATLTVSVTGTKDGYSSATTTSAATAAVAPAQLTPGTPTITGTVKVGSVVTAVPGTWSPAPVTFTYQWLRDGAVISGATAVTRTISTLDAGKTISVRVTGSKSGYATVSATSAGTVAAPGTLTTATPTVAGTARTGETLTATPGTWGPSPVSLAYVWSANGATISGATQSTYIVDGSLVGKSITVTVIGSKTGYASSSQTSAATGKVVAGTITSTTPVIVGTSTVGQTLSVDLSGWGPAPVTFAYQWKASGANITGATGSTFVLTQAQLGKTIKVTVTGTKLGYTSVASTSAVTPAVAAAPVTSGTPSVAGTAKVGSTLTAKTGIWGPSPVTFTYQWLRDGVAIAGSTASTRSLTTNDSGHAISVTVTGSKSGYQSVTKTSAPTATVIP
ncbi:hypothetical protein B7R54_03915 [Subtercola boreus]|uniref:alpha-amylase n=1 Tax=Subtercola boreus TaxID=120213 RepID=A0A3E0VEW5_9MICO|nr:SdrD B-like domain-containing protein [Subtercola boreus]RFA08464.1 hypothetical protein B7R54_03915 [Subtercola boreus]TQL54617.1 SdrD B-like protein [Subtercola boreus]